MGPSRGIRRDTSPTCRRALTLPSVASSYGPPPLGWCMLFRRRQMVFQDPMESLNARRTVGEILAEPLSMQGIGDRASRISPPLSVRVLRRPASAHRHCSRHRLEPALGDLRRARICPRRFHPKPNTQSSQRLAEITEPLLSVHRTRLGGGKAHFRPHRHHVPRQKSWRPAAAKTSTTRPNTPTPNRSLAPSQSQTPTTAPNAPC